MISQSYTELFGCWPGGLAVRQASLEATPEIVLARCGGLPWEFWCNPGSSGATLGVLVDCGLLISPSRDGET